MLEKVLRRAEGWRKLPTEQTAVLFGTRCYWCEVVGVILARCGGRDRTVYEHAVDNWEVERLLLKI